MIRYFALSALATAALLLTPRAACAQESGAESAPAKSANMAEEVRELRHVIAQQTLQMEILTRAVRDLQSRLGPEADTPVASTPEPAPTAAATPPPAGGATPPGNPPAEGDVPRAEPTGGGVKHIVAKGETLTSIAKNYNIGVAVLQKANKIQDGRKLQIGQVLSIPTPAEQAAPEKKETP